jgi:putative transposase
MANSYSQINIHYIFVTKERSDYFTSKHKSDIISYMIGISANLKCYIHSIEAVGGHMHLLVSLKPNVSVSEYAKMIKGNVSKHINEMRFYPCHFEWQEGYGAFSVSQSSVVVVKEYIQNQEEHHRKHTFQEEFKAMLEKYEIPFDEKYLFR